MHREKIVESITSAMNHIENSLRALANQEEGGVAQSVWYAAAETEYALFLFSLSHKGESTTSSTRGSSTTKQTEVGPALSSAQDLLREAKENLSAGRVEEAHEKTWDARGFILRVWDLLEKKRKAASKAVAVTPP